MNVRRAAIALAALLACDASAVDVQVEDGPHRFTRAEAQAIRRIGDVAVRDARRQLPMLPSRVTILVRSGKDVIPETGENATTVPPATVAWTLDPDRDVVGLARAQLRGTLFHELHHLARAAAAPRRSLMDDVVSEGLATAFERDAAGARPPWGQPPPEVMDWTRELLAQPADAPRDVWLIRHPDGRRWIGMRVGTFLVDRAMAATHRSAAELVSTPTDEILRLAGVR